MARVSRSIQIPDKDREHLEDMLHYTDQRTAERIRIVLACSGESSNKAVATMLHTDEHKVANWKDSKSVCKTEVGE